MASILAFLPSGLTNVFTGVLAQNANTGNQGMSSSGPPSVAAIGAISNIQQDESGEIAWILSGNWKLRVYVNTSDDATAAFAASIRMVSAEGTSMHAHKISDFVLSSWSIENSTKIFNGTATITLRDGPTEDIPISLEIKNKGLIRISVDSDVVDHFGSAPIYGTVLRVFDNTDGKSVHGQMMHDMHGTRPMNASSVHFQGLNASSVTYFPNATGYLAYPENASALPSVVMIHEWWGLNQNIKNEAEKLANEGYVVLAVDLYKGEVATESEKARELSTAVRNNPQSAVDNLQGAVAYLSTLPNVNSSRIASLGWCFGGGWSLQLALNTEQPLAATVIYYGNLVTDSQTLSNITWPVLGIFGATDQSIPIEIVKQFESALNANDITNEIYIYEGVGHAFANPSGDNYAATEAEDASKKTLEFLKEHV